MCIMHGDFVSEDMHREAIEFLEQEKIVEFRRLKYEATVKLLDYGRVEVDRSTISAEEMVAKMYADNADEVFQPDTRLVGTTDLQFLRDGDIMREQISKSLYLEHLERDTNIAFDEVKELTFWGSDLHQIVVWDIVVEKMAENQIYCTMNEAANKWKWIKRRFLLILRHNQTHGDEHYFSLGADRRLFFGLPVNFPRKLYEEFIDFMRV
ncbi:hypothetical protein R1sor_017835 [Riccia sorocarpa]|uniref:Uncharacterized protein n=1 Tax=Riccia sorocarpa TaxID=122646 RepID=A0ABD3I818_9MARC